MEIDSLITLATAALASELSNQERIERLTRYVEAFSEWAGKGGLASSQQKEQLQTLLRYHSLVLERAKETAGETAKGIRELKRKVRGILAYTDTLPKRLSSRAPRKG